MQKPKKKIRSVVLLRTNPVSPDPPVEKTADALLQEGYRVTVLAWDRGSRYSQKNEFLTLPHGRASIVRFGIEAVFEGGLKKSLPAMAKFQLRMAAWLQKNRDKYDCIHAFDFDTGFVAEKIARRYGKAFVYHILDFYAAVRSEMTPALVPMLTKAEFSVINHADAVIICTEKRLEQIIGSYPKSVTVIHNSPEKIREDNLALPLPPTKLKRIVYVGILGEARLIREMIEIVKADERFEYHIGGFGPIEDYVRSQAEECDRIFYYGKLPYAKTLSLETQADILTALYDPKVSNHRYAAPNKLYESLMLGKPVIMARGTGWDEVIEENGNGVLIDFTLEGLRSGLEKINKMDLEEVSRKAKLLYEKHYSQQIMKERLQALYRELQ